MVMAHTETDLELKPRPRLGDVEHLRGLMPEPGTDLEAGRLYWLTDRWFNIFFMSYNIASRYLYNLLHSDLFPGSQF